MGLFDLDYLADYASMLFEVSTPQAGDGSFRRRIGSAPDTWLFRFQPRKRAMGLFDLTGRLALRTPVCAFQTRKRAMGLFDQGRPVGTRDL